MKLYDKAGKFVKTVAQPKNKFRGLQAFNEQGLFARSQLSKSGKTVMRSYVGG